MMIILSAPLSSKVFALKYLLFLSLYESDYYMNQNDI